MARVGILGGSFNPIHMAHLVCAERAREEEGLDRVLFVPAAQPPHKPHMPMAPAEHRARMVELAIAGNPHFALDRLELEREGPSYTIETVRSLRAAAPDGTEFLLLLGADSLLELHTWWHAEELAREVPIIAFHRPGHPIGRRWAELADRFGADWAADVRRRMVAVPQMDVSATELRRRVAAGLSIRYLVPEPVERYIAKHRLYR